MSDLFVEAGSFTVKEDVLSDHLLIKSIKELEAQVVKEQDAGMEMLSRITELERPDCAFPMLKDGGFRLLVDRKDDNVVKR